MAGRSAIDAIDLARELIRCPSVTPIDAGALDRLQAVLTDLGFVCHRLRFEEATSEPVDNLYARFGDGAPNFCFAGHTDVVPVGDRNAWSVDPFAAEIRDGALFGRGASDMKSAVAAFVAAADRFVAETGSRFAGSISLLITGDEEGPAVNGTVKVLDWMAAHGEQIDACLVGEPTNPTRLGEMVKVGRRGSLSAEITVYGTQGHVAYPHLADNPIPRLIAILDRLNGRELDRGNDDFQPSNLEITSIDVGNEAGNVIPAAAHARLNIRFNTEQSAEGLDRWIRETCAAAGGRHEVRIHCNSHPFLTPPGPLREVVVAAVEEVLGERPAVSTTGGTSDARFIKDHCPVVEFGLVGQTMHKVDEQARIEDIEALSRIYHAVLRRYFSP